MPLAARLLGWNAFEVYRGELLEDRTAWTRVPLDWQPADIRNCSYAARPRWIGITAEDQAHGDQVLGVYEEGTSKLRILKRFQYVLHHALNQDGTKLCYTEPSAQRGLADLYDYDLSTGQVRILLAGGIAQDSIPGWFPGDERVAYHTPDGHIEVWDLSSGQGKRLAEGRAPTVSPSGERIAFQRDDQIFVWSQATGDTEPVDLKLGWRKRSLTDGLSWAPDERHLSFGTLAGLTDKETVFYLLSLEDGESTRIESEYLRGLILL